MSSMPNLPKTSCIYNLPVNHVCCLLHLSFVQPCGHRLGQLENAKIAFITNRVVLTQDKAQKFWPLYNEFSDRRRDLNRSGRLLRRDVSESLSDPQIRENITQSFALRQQELNLEKEYFEKFQKVISLRQVAQLFAAERDFTREVIKRVSGAPGQTNNGQ